MEANAAGAGALGLRVEDCAARPLDIAMPAMVRLMESIRRPGENADEAGPETLVFWTGGRVHSVDCRIRKLQRNGSDGLVLVELLEPAASGEAQEPDEERVAVSGPGVQSALRDDAAILKAIARQILGGRLNAAAVSGGGPDSGGSGGMNGGDGDGGANGGDGSGAARRAQVAGAPAMARDDGTKSDDPARGGAARRTLVRRIAHELKTPLSAIASASEIMRDERFGAIGDERYLRYARDIHESALHALAVVERMLSPQAAAVTIPEPEVPEVRADGPLLPEANAGPIDIGALVSATASTVEVLGREAGIVLTTSIAGELPYVRADATSVRQIVLNLLTNALKFTPQGGRVEIAALSGGDGGVVIEVSDTGPGFSEQDIDAIGATEAEAERAPRKGGGFGIGLPLVRRLAIANDAELWIGRSPAGGARVTVVFPPRLAVPQGDA
ncbi:MAG: sensor histidine kinase [Hyphomicrobiaceae bacterium]